MQESIKCLFFFGVCLSIASITGMVITEQGTDVYKSFATSGVFSVGCQVIGILFGGFK